MKLGWRFIKKSELKRDFENIFCLKNFSEIPRTLQLSLNFLERQREKAKMILKMNVTIF